MIPADRYCRTCLKELNDLVDSLRKHFITPDIADKLICCTMISVELNDELPKHLCDCCSDQLEKFNAFRMMCHESVVRFREMLSTTSNLQIIKSEENIAIEEIPVAETNLQIVKEEVNYLENSTSFLEIEMHEFSAQKVDPLEIQINKKRNRKKISAKVKSKKGIRITFDSVKKEETCADRPNAPTSDSITTSCSRGGRTQRSKPAIEKVPEDEPELKPYPCPHAECEHGFERFQSLQYHLKQHEDTVNLISCEEPGCNHRYRRKHGLTYHLRKHHKKNLKKLNSYVCEVCGKVVKTAGELNNHRYIHKDKSELPLACSEPDCKQRFYKKQELKVHMMRHDGIKKFECSFCGTGKTTKSELNVHMNYHTLERQFPCQSCPHIFSNPGNLKRHVREVHEHVRNFACRHCDRTFAKDETRKHHEMIHTGEKPHECSVCGKRFIQRSALRRHQKTHLRQEMDFGSLFKKKLLNKDVLSGFSGNNQCNF